MEKVNGYNGNGSVQNGQVPAGRTERKVRVMNPFSILMFMFSGGLLLYAALLAITKDYNMIARHYATKVKDGKEYAARFARVIALVAVAPAYSGIIAQVFSEGIGMVVLVIQMVLTIGFGTQLMK